MVKAPLAGDFLGLVEGKACLEEFSSEFRGLARNGQSQRTTVNPNARSRSSRFFSARTTSRAESPPRYSSRRYFASPSNSPIIRRSRQKKSVRATKPSRSRNSTCSSGFGKPSRCIWARLKDSPGDPDCASAKSMTPATHRRREPARSDRAAERTSSFAVEIPLKCRGFTRWSAKMTALVNEERAITSTAVCSKGVTLRPPRCTGDTG